MDKKVSPENSDQSGFSLLELLVVVAIVMILSGIMLFYLSAHQKLYKPDDQALQLADILQEARQRALAQRETLRVELNLTTNMATLINENSPSVSSDDVVIKRFTLFSTGDVKISARPSQITVNPPEPMPVPTAVFKTSVYPGSAGNSVCTIRFLSNGTAVDAGTTDIGTGAVQTGVSLFVWSPKKTAPTESEQARAITVLGATGAIRMWEYDASLTTTNKWKDSRKSTAY
jgi:prepilin-type N-terminal cleavage/methylation domain-containing protein